MEKTGVKKITKPRLTKEEKLLEEERIASIQAYILANIINQCPLVMSVNLNVTSSVIISNISALIRKKKLTSNWIPIETELIIADEPIIPVKVARVKKVRPILGKFTNENGENKKKARERTENAIISVPYSGKPIITLCGVSCITELNLLKYNPTFSSQMAENEYYHDVLLTIANNKLPIHAFNGNIGDLIVKSHENEYSHGIFDFCGQFMSIYQIIILILNKKIVEVGGILTFTMQKRCGSSHEDIDFYNSINPVSEDDEIKKCENALKNLFLAHGGINYRILQRFPYKDTSSMVLFILQRIS